MNMTPNSVKKNGDEFDVNFKFEIITKTPVLVGPSIDSLGEIFYDIITDCHINIFIGTVYYCMEMSKYDDMTEYFIAINKLNGGYFNKLFTSCIHMCNNCPPLKGAKFVLSSFAINMVLNYMKQAKCHTQ